MLDINYVREHLDEVRERLATRGFDVSILDRFSELDVRRRSAITESGELSAERNRLSPEIGKLMKEGRKDEAEGKRERVKELKERIEALEAERDAAEEDLNRILYTVPNLPDPSVPVGQGRVRERRGPPLGKASRVRFRAARPRRARRAARHPGPAESRKDYGDEVSAVEGRRARCSNGH